MKTKTDQEIAGAFALIITGSDADYNTIDFIEKQILEAITEAKAVDSIRNEALKVVFERDQLRAQLAELKEWKRNWYGLRDAVLRKDNAPCFNFSVVEGEANKLHETIDQLRAQLAETEKNLVAANKGAERNAHINASLAKQLAEVTKERDMQSLRQKQQSDLIECYTQEGIRQRKEIDTLREQLSLSEAANAEMRDKTLVEAIEIVLKLSSIWRGAHINTNSSCFTIVKYLKEAREGDTTKYVPQAELDKANALLRELEWEGLQCPICMEFKDVGHASDCPLSTHLQGA